MRDLRRRVEEKFGRYSRAGSAASSATPSIIGNRSAGQDDPPIARPSTEARPADHNQPVTASQASYPAAPVESLPKPTATDLIGLSDLTNPVSEELWNAAYKKVEEKDDELVRDYMKTLRVVLGGEPDDLSTTDLLAEMEDPIARQQHMRELVVKGQERISNSKVTAKVGGVADFILSFKGIVDLIPKAVPQTAPAALPWAGACLLLEILRMPAQEMNSNLGGIAHVISRMDWYCALVELLLGGDNNTRDDFKKVLSRLRETIIELYEALLLYQMKSVRSYYRSRGARFLYNMVGSDDWEDAIRLVQDIETRLQSEINQYYQERTKTSLDGLARSADKRTALLGNLGQDIRTFIAQQKDAVRDQTESDCRRDLRVVDPEVDMMRIESSKDKLLDDAYKWIFDTTEYKSFTTWENDSIGCPLRQLLWLKGHAGTGKTMLMIGLIRQFSNQSAALAPGISFFFCQDTNAELRNASAILRSLIWLLLLQQPHLMSHLLQKYKDSGANLFRDENAFYALSEVFKNMLGDPNLSPVYLAVDALDECSEDREKFIDLISTTLPLSRNVKWLLSSRPEVDVLAELKTSEAFVELDTQCLAKPVGAYIEHKLRNLRGKKGYNEEILKEISVIAHERAENTFLWVALVFKALTEKHGKYAVEHISKMPTGLLELYQHMMTRIEAGKAIELQECKEVLKAVVLASRPLCLSELSLVTGLTHDFTKDVVDECGSFVTMTGETVNLIHQSAKDYLNDKYTSILDPAGVAQGHTNIIKRSLNAISSLERNIYNLDPGSKSWDITPPSPDPLVRPRYSCIFWVDHLCSLTHENPECLKTTMADVLGFLEKGFLRWLECLSLLGKVDDGAQLMIKLVQFIQSQTNVDPGLAELLKDADRFFFTYKSGIQQAPLQTYISALVFSPTLSKVRNQYWKERMPIVDVITGVGDDWGVCRHILEATTSTISAVAFSPDSKTLASGSYDDTIRLWDVATGVHKQTLKGHTNGIKTVAFSPDGKTLASGSYDKAIQLWNAATGVHKQTLEGHTSLIQTIAYTPDGKILASDKNGNIVTFVDMTASSPNGKVLRGDVVVVTAAFSPDGKKVALVLDGSVIQLRDLTIISTGSKAVEWHSRPVTMINFAPGGKKLASASEDATVRLWDITATLQTTAILQHDQGVSIIAFSPDGKSLASATLGGTIWLWDLTTASPSKTAVLKHDDPVYRLTFSPDGKSLASAMLGGAVWLWDLTTASPSKTAVLEHDGLVYLLGFSPDGKSLASATLCRTVWLWDLTTASPSKTAVLKHGVLVYLLTFSPDGKSLASTTLDETIRLWDLSTTSPSKRVLLKHSNHMRSIAFSMDGGTLKSTTHSGEVLYWDVITGNRIADTLYLSQLLYDYDPQRCSSYAFRSDSSWITLNGKDLLWLPAECRPVHSKQRAAFGSIVVVGTNGGRVVVIRFPQDTNE